MGSKNNPKNRVKSQKKEYNGQEVTPALFMSTEDASEGAEKSARRMVVGQYVKTRKLVTDAEGKPLAWSALQ
ncbi:MAG: hypothetical protein ABW189_02035 [Rickettsiales bacterium]